MKAILVALMACALSFAQNAQKQIMIADTDAPLTPIDSPGGGTYGSTKSVTLSDATSALILYTTDGSTPACPGTGTLYTGAISISVTTTLKAIGCNGVTGGGVLTSVYTISGGPSLVTGQICRYGPVAGGSCSFPSGVTAGNMLWLGIYNDTSGVPSAVKDSAGNSMTQATGSPCAVTGTVNLYFYYELNAPSGLTGVQNGATSAGTVYAQAGEFSGVAMSSALDALTCNSGTQTAGPTNPPTVTTGIPAMAGELAIGLMRINAASAITNPSGGWAEIENPGTSMQSTWNVTSGSAITATWGSTGNGAWGAGILLLKP